MPPRRKSSVSGPRLPDAGLRAGEVAWLFDPVLEMRAEDWRERECGRLKMPWPCGRPV